MTVNKRPANYRGQIFSALCAAGVMMSAPQAADAAETNANGYEASQLLSLLQAERTAFQALEADQIIGMEPRGAATQGGKQVATTEGNESDVIRASIRSLKQNDGAQVDQKSLQCLAQALYFEARGESRDGQVAVAEVILNRVDSRRYPATVCSVVRQGAKKRNACQFSFACDGRAEKIHNRAAYSRATDIARSMLAGKDRDLTGGATHFHTTAVSPSWSRKLKRTTKIGSHIFYRLPKKISASDS